MHLVGFLSLHTLLTTHGHRNLKYRTFRYSGNWKFKPILLHTSALLTNWYACPLFLRNLLAFLHNYFENQCVSRYLLAPWCRVLLEKLTGLHLVKKLRAFHGSRRFITALTSVRHLSLPWTSSIQSITPHPTSWRSILILSSHLRLVFQVVSFSQVSPPKPCTRLSPPPYELHAPPISFFSI